MSSILTFLSEKLSSEVYNCLLECTYVQLYVFITVCFFIMYIYLYTSMFSKLSACLIVFLQNNMLECISVQHVCKYVKFHVTGD